MALKLFVLIIVLTSVCLPQCNIMYHICKIRCTGSPVICTLYDDTPGTGSTTLVVRAGAEQGITDLQQWKNAAGVTVGVVNYMGTFGTQGNFSMGSNSGGIYFGSAADLAIFRTSAGRIQINSSTAGKWGGLDTGSVSMKSLATPGAPTVTPTCTADCTATWTYHVEGCLADGTTCTAVSATGTTAAQNATIDATNYNTLTCTAVTGVTKYRFRRHASGGTPATLGLIGTAATCSLVDNGLAGNGSADPTLNQTGMVTMAAAVSPSAATDVCVAGNIWWDASYIYICTASGVIKRAGIAGW